MRYPGSDSSTLEVAGHNFQLFQPSVVRPGDSLQTIAQAAYGSARYALLKRELLAPVFIGLKAYLMLKNRSV